MELLQVEPRTITNLARVPSVLQACVRPPRISGGAQDDSREEDASKWEAEDVEAWLQELGLSQYQGVFEEHAVDRGCVLLCLEEGHLREMGVGRVGHRLLLMDAIATLREQGGHVTRGVDHMHLLHHLERAKDERNRKLFPKRIILIRHAESQGNVDNALYAHVADCQLKLTERGRKQAIEAGSHLKSIIGEESCTFYVSPFIRSQQTYQELRQSLQDDQVLCVREDPRIREQEWGNFQEPSRMATIMKQRREIGSFYYRFPTGESGADVFDRASMFLETLYRDMERGICGDNIVIVSHGLFCRLFLTRYYHWPVEKFHKLWNFENCQQAVMELQASGSYKLVTHLKTD